MDYYLFTTWSRTCASILPPAGLGHSPCHARGQEEAMKGESQAHSSAAPGHTDQPKPGWSPTRDLRLPTTFPAILSVVLSPAAPGESSPRGGTLVSFFPLLRRASGTRVTQSHSLRSAVAPGQDRLRVCVTRRSPQRSSREDRHRLLQPAAEVWQTGTTVRVGSLPPEGFVVTLKL